MGISEQDIEDYMERGGKKAGMHASVWVVKLPSVINMAVFGSMSTLFDMKFNILNISEEGIMLIGVNTAGRLMPEHLWFSWEQIQEIHIKKGIIAYELLIKTQCGLLKYRLNKVEIGSGFHKANMENVIQKLENCN